MRGSLSHPNIAQVFDYGEPAGAEPGYLVMELVDGLSLTRILDDGPLSPEDVMDVVAQTARGLAAATAPGWCTATSSRETCCSGRTAWSRSRTSGSPTRTGRRPSPSPGC